MLQQQSAGRWGQGRSQHLHQLEVSPEDRVVLVYLSGYLEGFGQNPSLEVFKEGKLHRTRRKAFAWIL